MSTLISNASGNLTGAATFAAAETGALALALARNAVQALPGSTTSVTFTVTSGKVIDGVLLWVKQAATGSTGTFKVDLQKGGVSQASVTVNKTDLPDVTNPNPIPVFFKFTSTATGDGGSNWTIVGTNTGTNNISYWVATAVSGNFTRALRTTTAQTPAAADDLYITGELTGAGTHNSITVTMDSTAATAYGNGALNSTTVAGGGIHVSNYGTLSYGTMGSTSVPATWDSATATSVTLSGGDLVATSTGGSTDHGCHVAAAAGQTTGKYYFEITVTTNVGGGDTGFGIGTTTSTYSGMGNGGGVVGDEAYIGSGNIWTNGSNSGWGLGGGGLANGTVTGVAVDLDNRKIWFRRSPSGDWNNNSSANPVTNANGIVIPAGTMVPFATFNASGNVFTANFGGSAFTGSVPSGFTAGWATSVATPVAPTPGVNYILRVNGDLMVYQFGTLNMGSSAAGSSLATFDGVTSSQITLSNGGLTATIATGSAYAGTRSTTLLSTGKYYFEYKLNQVGSSAVGILLSTGSNITDMNNGQNCFEVWTFGDIYTGNNGQGSLGAMVAGDVIGFAIDLTARVGWVRKNTGNWNGSGTANPATGVGGLGIAAGAFSPALLFTSSSAVGDGWIGNFGQSAFINAAPSGFGNWATTTTASTAVLEFQQASADGDFGLRCLDNSVVTITGQPRTAGKNVVKCKLTANVVGAGVADNGFYNVVNVNVNMNAAVEASGNSLFAVAISDTGSNVPHGIAFYWASSVTNTTQTATAWLARGSGLNNRYIRFYVGNSTTFTAISSGFYSDLDLQAGTAGTVTAVGTGTATSVSITPVGAGYVVRMTGKISSGSAAPAFYIMACAVAGTTTYAGNGTQNFLVDHAAIYSSTPSDTIFNVDTDTGWLSGDAVCVASTSRTAAECEIYPLNANAGASSFTSALYPFGTMAPTSIIAGTHSGTAPTQAEIGLLTRNVKIRSTSNTLMSYVYCTALATVTASWAEFYYVGATTANKRGIEIDGGAVCNPKNFTYCSLHDLDSYGLFCNVPVVTSLNLTFSNNVVWNSYAGTYCLVLTNTITNHDWIFDNNLTMRSATTYGFFLGTLGGVFTNNTLVGFGANSGIYLGGAVQEALGTFNGNTVHSGNVGCNLVTPGMPGTISNFTVWHNTNSGVVFNAVNSDLVFANLVLFGNSTSVSQGNFNISAGDSITIQGGLIAGDTSFPVAAGFSNNGVTAMVQLNLSNLDMSGTGSIYAPHTTNDFYSQTAPTHFQGVSNNCKFGAPNVISAKSPYWSKGSYLSFQKYNQTAGDHRTEMTYGQLKTDSAVYNTASPSMRMTPNSASNKLESAPLGKGLQVAVDNGNTITVKVWIRKDSTYTGAQPRLIVRANAAIGINADTVLAAATDVTTSTSYSTWDPATVTAVTLSGGNLVATNTGTTSADQGAHVVAASGKTSGKYYFETTMTSFTAPTSSSNGIGIGTTASTYTGMGTNATTGVIMYRSGGIWANGANSSVIMSAVPTPGSIVGIAVDLDNRKIWFRFSPSGTWNGATGTPNPATNVSGITIPAGTMVPFATFGGTGGTASNVTTANFGASAFSGAVPSGFTAGWGTPAGGTGTATWVQLTGTTAAATDDGVMEFIVDCDGTAGFVNVDDWLFTSGTQTTSCDMSNWYNGLPISEPAPSAGGGGAYFSAGFV